MKNHKGDRLLVTGGAGFIGSSIVKSCVNRGIRVRVLDNLSSGKKERLLPVSSQIEFIEGDIRDRKMVTDSLAGITHVIHEAALRSVPGSMKEPYEYNDVNVTGTLNLLVACRDAAVQNLVFASSSAVYGESTKLPQGESDPIHPVSPYALNKLVGEQYCRLFSKAYNLSTVSLRYFNVFGPGQSVDDEYALVIPKFITCLMKGEPPPIFGDGYQSRDFTYIDNVVEATLTACFHEKTGGEVYNASGGDSKTILEVASGINRILGTDIKPVFCPPRPGDARHTCADPRKIERDLGWKCRLSFEEGLHRTVDSFKAVP